MCTHITLKSNWKHVRHQNQKHTPKEVVDKTKPTADVWSYLQRKQA